MSGESDTGPGLGVPGEPSEPARGRAGMSGLREGPSGDTPGPGSHSCNWTWAACPRANIFSDVVLIKPRIKLCVLKLEQMFVLMF